MLNPNWFENSREGGVATLQSTQDESTLPLFIPLQTIQLEGLISGPLGEFSLIHVFRFGKDLYPHPIEAIYRFPLPGDAAVLSVMVTFGSTEVQTELKDRKEAEALYNKARDMDHPAFLTTRESPDVFTLHLNGIAPDEDVVVKTTYLHAGRPEGTGFSFRIPLTAPPRYVREDERYNRQARAQPLVVLSDSHYRFSLRVEQRGEGSIESATHSLTMTAEGIVSLTEGEMIPDRDCVLTWKPSQQENNPLLQVYQDASGEHFLALVSPPAQNPSPIPRDVILLVDHSGSMSGPKREAANWAVEKFLRGLTDQDVFNLCLFESTTHWFSSYPQQATQTKVEHAISYLNQLDAGGTELGIAIEQALLQPRSSHKMARHLLIITDAQVTDEGRILHLIAKEQEREDHRRCNILCIDASPNSYLVHQMAELSGGASRFLTSSPNEEDITSCLDNLLKEWDAPLLTGAQLEVNRDKVHVLGRKVVSSESGRSCIDLGDLPAGKNIWILGKVKASPSPLTFSIPMLGDGVTPLIVRTPSIKMLYGAMLVNTLERFREVGYGRVDHINRLREFDFYGDLVSQMSEMVYPENRTKVIGEQVTQQICSASLLYGILSSETAFVAVVHDRLRGSRTTIAVPNTLPYGWHESFADNIFYSTSNCSKKFSLTDRIISRLNFSNSKDVLCCRRLPDFYVIDSQSIQVQHPHKITLFVGKPAFKDNVAVLFDSSNEDMMTLIPGPAVFHRLMLMIKGDKLKVTTDPYLVLYLDDLAKPRITVMVRDLLINSMGRPLNLSWSGNGILRLLLVDPKQELQSFQREIEVTIV